MPKPQTPEQPAFIATIGHQQFGLASIQDAETLLRLLSGATPLEECCIGEPGVDFRVVMVTNAAPQLGVSLVSSRTPLISRDEYTQLVQHAAAARAARGEEARPNAEAA